MATTTPTTEVAVIEPEFSDTERYALSGFLAGYRGLTREAYALDLRQFIAWCADHDLRLFAVRRADIECFARDLEGRGRARATVGRRLCTVAGFYRYAEQEGLLEPGCPWIGTLLTLWRLFSLAPPAEAQRSRSADLRLR